MSLPKCPICGRVITPELRAAAAPFCSPRCRQVDLNRWLGEAYAVPTAASEEDEVDERSNSPSDDDYSD